MRNFKIAIPEPCHENWQQMTNTQKGKFCNVCAKEVFDFTKYSDNEIIKKFSKTDDNLCGRFTTVQLNKKWIEPIEKPSNFAYYIFSGLLSLFVFNSDKVFAQIKTQTSIHTSKEYTSIPLKNTQSKDSIITKGIVLDENNLPLPIATILEKGTTNGVSSNFEGVFTLICKKDAVLVISYLGYITQEIKATENIILNLQRNKNLKNVVITSMGIVRQTNELSKSQKNIIAKGIVFDENNNPMPIATIVEKGTTNGISTNSEGEFTLTCKKNAVLVISYVGYENQEIKASEKIQVNLNPDNSLNDTVIVAGGIERIPIKIETDYTTNEKKTEEVEFSGSYVLIAQKKRSLIGNLFIRFTNIFRKENKNPKYKEIEE